MKTYVIRRRSAWANEGELKIAAGRSKVIGDEMPDKVRWIRSYVVQEDDGRLGTVCIYDAADPESIVEHARRMRMPADEITLIADTVIVRQDPIAA
ncbi:MAG: DUF4242 domain-containing protein [Bryobacterales bacterium]